MLQSCLFVSTACQDLLQLVVIVSHLVMEKIIPTQSQLGIGIQTSHEVLCHVASTPHRGDVTDLAFLCAFFLIFVPDSQTLQPTQES